MKKVYDSTFGQRLANAQHLATIMAGFSSYKSPRISESLEEFNKLITAIAQTEQAVTGNKSSFSLAGKERRELLRSHADSVQHRMTPIIAAVHAQYGRSSKEAADVMSKIRSLRGKRVKKADSSTDGETAAPKSKTVSVSHTAYGSITKSLSDVIAAISQFTPAYDPANPDISIPSLLMQHSHLLTVSNKLSSGYAAWQSSKNLRDQQYADLADRTQHIKDAVKSQYGIKSHEYGLIKTIKV